MLARIQVGLKLSLKDSFGDNTAKRINNDLHLPVEKVRTIKVFTVDAGITDHSDPVTALTAISTASRSAGPFCDPVYTSVQYLLTGRMVAE
jgi:phosphoribosylformylglycinamidine synthase subunit PurSL